MATGAPAVAAWVLKRMKAEWAKQKAFLCKNADKVYDKLKSAGADVPKRSKWDDLSCDQKLAFIAALGPYGLAMLAAGALVAGWASDAAGEFKKWGGNASDELDRISKRLGLKAPSIPKPSVSVGGRKLLGLGEQYVPRPNVRGFGSLEIIEKKASPYQKTACPPWRYYNRDFKGLG